MVIPLVILNDYHNHEGSRFLNDGIFADNKMQLQYHPKKEDIPAIAEKGKDYFKLADNAYRPIDVLKTDPEITSRYEFLERKVDEYGLKATAFRDKQTGKIVISIAGLEIKEAESKTETAKDVVAAFRATAGKVSDSMNNLVDFTKNIKEKYGEVTNITGHSLGSYEAMQLKVIADKQGLTSKDCEMFLYDCPGMTHGLAKGLHSKFGVEGADIEKSLHSKNVYTFINDFNSFNTLGAMPGNIIMATDPEKTNYKEFQLAQLMPKHHFLPDFQKSFDANAFQFEGHNNAHARGPEYLTEIVTGLAGVTPLAAIPVARNIQGAIADLVPDHTTLLHSYDPKVIDGLRSQNGEVPNMVAYKHLNEAYAECFNKKFSSLEFGTREEKIAIAEEYAGKPEVLQKHLEEKIKTNEAGIVEKPWYTKLSAWVLGKNDANNLPTSLAEANYQNCKAALAELNEYKKDYSNYLSAPQQNNPIDPELVKQAQEAVHKDLSIGDKDVQTPSVTAVNQEAKKDINIA